MSAVNDPLVQLSRAVHEAWARLADRDRLECAFGTGALAGDALVRAFIREQFTYRFLEVAEDPLSSCVQVGSVPRQEYPFRPANPS